jgi:hypothetical protein
MEEKHENTSIHLAMKKNRCKNTDVAFPLLSAVSDKAEKRRQLSPSLRYPDVLSARFDGKGARTDLLL